MPDSPVIVAIAKRRSGKSFLVRDLMYQMRKRFVGGIVMSATEEANGFYQDMGVPPAYIYHEFDEGALERLIETQKKLTKAGKVQLVFVILDDVAYNKTIFNRSVIRQLALNGRYGFATHLRCIIPHVRIAHTHSHHRHTHHPNTQAL